MRSVAEDSGAAVANERLKGDTKDREDGIIGV